MNKKSFSFFLLLLMCFQTKAQLGPSDVEIRDNIQYFRDRTVSFGVDTIVTFKNSDGKIITKEIFSTVGTGVIFYIKIRNQVVPCIVTAKHVLTDTLIGWKPKSLRIRFSNNDTLPIDTYFGRELHLFGDKNLPTWFEHSDPSVDLAAIVLPPSKDTSVKNVMAYSTIPNDEDYYEGKEVYVLGYPSAVGLDLLNKAILRKGIISWVPMDINQSGKKILIDCNIFPGNSGGPVFSIPKIAGVVLYDTIFQKPMFYGIVSQRRFSGNYLYSNGKIFADSLGKPITSIESIGIGVIVTAKKVRELLISVQTQFDKWVEEEDKKTKKN